MQKKLITSVSRKTINFSPKTTGQESENDNSTNKKEIN